MTPSVEKPRVFSIVPSRGSGSLAALQSHYCLATRGAVDIIPGIAVSSLLCHSFNRAWSEVLKLHKTGMFDFFCMHHDDLEIRTYGWLDLLMDEMKRTGAVVLSVVNAIKGPGGECSTAIETGSPWNPTKIKIDDLATIPATFSAADTPFPKHLLLVNTGLLLIDLRHPAWFQSHIDDDGRRVLDFCFDMRHRIVVRDDGEFTPQVRPEDWELSRFCAANGMPVYATRIIDTIHHGGGEWPNQPKAAEVKPDDAPSGDIQGWFDFENLYRQAIRDVDDGGTLVEVGVWKGKSFCFLLNEAKKSGKTLRIIAVDHFRGSVQQSDLREVAGKENIEIEFRRNADAAGYPYKLIKSDSVLAASKIGVGSAEFVFIDASHDYDSVATDIHAWLPVVRPGGRLAGHDIDEIGVRSAVAEILPTAKKRERCWFYDVPEDESHAAKTESAAEFAASN